MIPTTREQPNGRPGINVLSRALILEAHEQHFDVLPTHHRWAISDITWKRISDLCIPPGDDLALRAACLHMAGVMLSWADAIDADMVAAEEARAAA